MAIERTRHMAVALGLFERMDDKTLIECFTSNGQSHTSEDVRSYLTELRSQGYEFMPCNCGNYDEKGVCKGAGGRTND